MKKKHLTPIAGRLFLKFFWRGVYTSRNVHPLKRVFKIYPFALYICIKPRRDNLGTIYKSECIEELEKYVKIETEFLNKNCDKVLPSEAVGRMLSCYSKQDGSYIGIPEDVWHYIFRFGIKTFHKAKPDNNVASIGFNPDERKWYGWSHRAIYGFEVGHIVKEGDCATNSGYTEEYIQEHPEENLSIKPGFKCENESDCKRVAIAFACSVS